MSEANRKRPITPAYILDLRRAAWGAMAECRSPESMVAVLGELLLNVEAVRRAINLHVSGLGKGASRG